MNRRRIDHWLDDIFSAARILEILSNKFEYKHIIGMVVLAEAASLIGQIPGENTKSEYQDYRWLQNYLRLWHAWDL